MRTVTITRYGDPDEAQDALAVVEQPDLQPAPDQVRVAVAAAAVNPVDRVLLAGVFEPLIGRPFPMGNGWDVAGVVDAIGADVSTVAVGERVVGLRDELVGPSGTHATQVLLPADAVAPAPAGVDDVAASTYALNALTADQALDLAGLATGQTLLVTGAAGAVGLYLVELGTRRGLRVIAQGSAPDEDQLRRSGAAEFVDRNADLVTAVRAIAPDGVDGAVDAAELGSTAQQAVRAGGVLVGVSDPSTPQAERGITVTTVHVHHDGARLAELTRGVEAGWLSLRVAETYTLDDVAKAYATAGTPGLRGRVVLTA